MKVWLCQPPERQIEQRALAFAELRCCSEALWMAERSGRNSDPCGYSEEAEISKLAISGLRPKPSAKAGSSK